MPSQLDRKGNEKRYVAILKLLISWVNGLCFWFVWVIHQSLERTRRVIEISTLEKQQGIKSTLKKR